MATLREETELKSAISRVMSHLGSRNTPAQKRARLQNLAKATLKRWPKRTARG